jgi:sterol desaturase/sphingolipid hydroxylase (fatty acid hydroxylase superfamily)
LAAELTSGTLTAALGHGPVFSQGENTAALMILYSVTVFIAFDFGSYVAHYLSHKVPILWEFHKVHHSAAVLTPLTVMRVHPVNFLVKSSVPAVTAGIVTGIFAYVLAEEPRSSTFLVIGFFNVSIITFATNIFANLRHSHLWLSFGPILSHILSSPAQHQIHHSIEPRHVDRNLGNVLSFWDWMFGTLYVPRTKESFEIGLKDGEHQFYSDIATLYVLPFRKAAGLVSASLVRRRRGGLT